MEFDAWKTYCNIQNSYIEFLTDNFLGAFPPKDQFLEWSAKKEQLENLWKYGCEEKGIDSLFANPLVEFSFPYLDDESGTFESLKAGEIATYEKPLHPNLFNLLQSTEMKDWIFKQHQVEAFRKSIDHLNTDGDQIKGQSIIVSSGTGSGKTEAFLIPMLNKMFWAEDDASLREPGIRTLIIYPMNALVNNQLQRLQNLLTGNDYGINFGFYTSRLKDEMTQKEINAMDSGNQSLYRDPNFIKDRKTLRDRPPHVLITNYSMLELMLIRPKDNNIFNFQKLQTIVLDEAHVYSGALGTDISLLLRRTADRFGTSMSDITGIATSATMDNTGEVLKNLSNFGGQLFSKDNTEIICITGTRKPLEEAGIFSTTGLTALFPP